MFILFAAGLTLSLWSEYSHNNILNVSGVMEGKETRFGVMNSVLWSVTTTVTSNGSVNAMHDSLSPLSGMVAMFNMMLGEIIFGGVGSGLYGMIIFIILTVFIAGLMVGRTPEYLGKKVEAFEMKMAILAVLAPSIVIKYFQQLPAQCLQDYQVSIMPDHMVFLKFCTLSALRQEIMEALLRDSMQILFFIT